MPEDQTLDCQIGWLLYLGHFNGIYRYTAICMCHNTLHKGYLHWKIYQSDMSLFHTICAGCPYSHRVIIGDGPIIFFGENHRSDTHWYTTISPRDLGAL